MFGKGRVRVQRLGNLQRPRAAYMAVRNEAGGARACPSPLRRAHESASGAARIVQATRGRVGASVVQLSGSFLPNLARLSPTRPRLLRFYYDSFTRGASRLKKTKAVMLWPSFCYSVSA